MTDERKRPRTPHAAKINWGNQAEVNAATFEYLEWLVQVPKPKKTARIAELAELKKELKDAFEERTNRWQAQIVLNEPSLLTLVSDEYRALIAAMFHPVFGMISMKMTADEYDKVPFVLPEAYQRVTQVAGEDDVLDLLSQRIREVHLAAQQMETRGENWAMHDGSDASIFLHNLRGAFGCDMWSHWQTRDLVPNRFDTNALPLRVIQTACSRGDIILWRGLHGSRGTGSSETSPGASVFLDFAPRDTITAEQRRKMCARSLAGVFEFGGGSARDESYNYVYRKAFPRMELTLLERYLCGDDLFAKDWVDALDSLAAVLNPVQREIMERDGYIILTPSDWLTHEQRRQWTDIVGHLRRDIEHYSTWTLITNNGLANLHLPPLRFDDARNRTWDALRGGRAACQDICGDEWAFYRRDSKGRRSHNAQNGGIMLSSESGMGAATNAYDLDSQSVLYAFRPLLTLFRDIYGTSSLLMIPERFRIKVRAAKLAIHTDTKPDPRFKVN